MIRIRRAADAASAAAGKGFPALLDLHTGREGTPDVCSYASHYPHIDYVWNGEGFDFGARPAYWLVEIASLVHGLTGDMLGSGESNVFRGMVFGMTQRDQASSQAVWRFWDATRIHEATALFGWWEVDGTPAVVARTAANASVLATTWSSFGSHAVVAVATWGSAALSATLDVDWQALGLDESTASATLPAIEGVQAAASLPSAAGPFELPPNGGLLLLITAPGFEVGEARRPRL